MSVDFRLIDFNYPFQSGVALSASSEDTEFPATNMARFLRGKTWRSSGSFNITASNNKIDFRETGAGPEITATLTIGIFSLSALLVEIKTQMEAETLNARTYTITQSAISGRWTIAGSVFLELLFGTGTNVATSIHSDIGFSGVDHTGSTFTSVQKFRFWRVKVVDPQIPNLYVEIHKIILGKDVDLTRIPDNGFSIDTEDLSKVIENDFGNQFVDEFPRIRGLSFNMNILEYSVKTQLDTIFKRVGNRTPIFIVLDTLGELFNKDDIAIYGRMGKDLNFGHIVRGNFKGAISVRESF